VLVVLQGVPGLRKCQPLRRSEQRMSLKRDLLTITVSQPLCLELHQKLRDSILPVVDKMDVELLFLPHGVNAAVTQDLSSVCASLDAVAKAANALVSSNAQVIALLAELIASQVDETGDDDLLPSTYLSGQSIR
jgi:hypothetical protein